MRTQELMRSYIELDNERRRSTFYSLGNNRYFYSHRQKNYALSLVDTAGVRGAARILLIPRRTIQRWCRQYRKSVKRYPDWIYDWAERKRKRREFWRWRGY